MESVRVVESKLNHIQTSLDVWSNESMQANAHEEDSNQLRKGLIYPVIELSFTLRSRLICCEGFTIIDSLPDTSYDSYKQEHNSKPYEGHVHEVVRLEDVLHSLITVLVQLQPRVFHTLQSFVLLNIHVVIIDERRVVE
jgi:hypothetical protein